MNHAPLFIREKIREGEISGSFSGAVLLADIIGFTSRFDRMAGLGAEGAELISMDVSKSLSAVVGVCNEFGGFPVSFAGDAVTVVFPGSMKDAQSARDRIRGLDSRDILPLRNSIGEGLVLWDAIPMDGWTFYSFQGPALRHAVMADPDFSGIQPTIPHRHNESTSLSSGIPTLECFNPPDLFAHGEMNEFRQVINIFLSLENRGASNCPRSFQELVLEIAGELRGFVSGLEAGKDDYHILVVFGAPVSMEDDPRRADLFLQRVFARSNGRVKAGVASGLVFSGLLKTPLLKSYTVLGHSVNLAARLHSSAGWNSVYSGSVFNRVSRLEIRKEMKIDLRGIARSVQMAVLSPWKRRVTATYPAPPLIERDELLNRLEAELVENDARILLTGATGMGKTRLAMELSHRLGDTSVISIRCEGLSMGSSDIFSIWVGEWMELSVGEGGLNAFREKLYGFIDLLDELNDPVAVEVSDELLRGESVLAAMVGLHWEGSLYQGLDPQGRFQNTISVTAAFIRGHYLLRKTVMIIDDLQWIDPDSMLLLTKILEELGNSRLPILLLTRPGITDYFQSTGLAPLEIELLSLSREGSRSFLEWSLGREPSEKLLAWFHHRTEGIPFFMEQYALMLTSATEPPDDNNFPGNIHALLVARLDRLESNLKEAALTASVLGRVFDPRILQSIMPDSDLKSILHRGVVERIWERAAHGQFSFVHILLRETAYNLQLLSERKRLHARAAAEIEGMWAFLPEKAHDIAFHLELANSKDDASLWYMKAGRHSFSRRMITTCLDQMKKVLVLSENISLKLDAHRMTYDLYASSGNWEEAKAAIELADQEVYSLKDKARVQLMRANLATNLGRPQDALELLDGLKEKNSDLRPQVLLLRGRILMLQAKTEEAMEHLLAVHEELRNGTTAERLVAIKALGNASGCMLRLSRRKEAENSLKQVLSYAIETGNLVMETLAVGNLALNSKYLTDGYRDTMRLTRRHLELAQKTGSRLLELQALGNLGSLLERKAPSMEALQLLEKAMVLAQKYGGSEAISVSLANMGGVLHRMGNSDRALEFFNDALSICSKEGLSIHKVDYAIERTRVLMDMGRLEKAGEQIEEMNEWSVPDDYIPSIVWCRGRLLRLQNNPGEAANVFREGLEQVTEVSEKYEFLYELYMITGDRKVLDECFELGEDILSRMPSWDFRQKFEEIRKFAVDK